MEYPRVLSRRARSARPSPIATLFERVGHRPDLISFAAGAPDPTLLPVDLLEELTHTAVKAYGPQLLQYGAVRGFPPLIEALLPILHDRAVFAEPEDVHITTGGTGALNAVCAAVLDPGDRVIVAEPSYAVETGVFAGYGARVTAVGCDADGVAPAALDAELARGPVKLIYLTPTFANPSGATMSLTRRAEVAALARVHNTLVVEDDAYADLRYTGVPLPSLYSFAPRHVVYIGSLSKLLAPAVRLGFTVMGAGLLEKVMLIKQTIDMQTSGLTQALATEFLTTYRDAHLALLRAAYATRLATMLTALDRAGLTGFTWARPDGGMFLWLRGPTGFRADDRLLDRAAAAGALFLPGRHFHVTPGRGLDTLRLSFGAVDDDRVAEGIGRLAPVLTG